MPSYPIPYPQGTLVYVTSGMNAGKTGIVSYTGAWDDDHAAWMYRIEFAPGVKRWILGSKLTSGVTTAGGAGPVPGSPSPPTPPLSFPFKPGDIVRVNKPGHSNHGYFADVLFVGVGYSPTAACIKVKPLPGCPSMAAEVMKPMDVVMYEQAMTKAAPKVEEFDEEYWTS